MNTSSWQSIRDALGPGLLWAGAAVGVSHLVQSTRAGASFGLGLLGLVIFANLYKYPAFSFGPRYAAATGTSLLEGYRREGRWALALYAAVTVATMFTVQAAVTFVTAALFTTLLGIEGTLAGQPAVVVLSAGLMAVCADLLLVGHYKWLDKIIKVVVVVLTLTTLLATAAVLPKLPIASLRLLPAGDWVTTTTTAVMICGLVGWMPSAFDISVWHSLWTLARRRETGRAPTVAAALFDFNVGYFGTALLALCFMAMGAGTMYGSGESFAAAPAAFAAQIVRLYTENLGAWTGPVVTLAAFAVMFSTTLTVIDGLPRALATLAARFAAPEVPGTPDAISRRVYWAALAVLFAGSMLVIEFFIRSLTRMVDVATVLSLLTAPVLAWLNHRAMISDVVPASARPGAALRAWSWCGIAISLVLAIYFVVMRWVVAG
ncbi:MAG: divalent metal cation transporter [Gammaproteobacteria bacterium]